MPTIFTIILTGVLKQLLELLCLFMIPDPVHEIFRRLAGGHIYSFAPVQSFRGISFNEGAGEVFTVYIDIAGLYACFTRNYAVPNIRISLECTESLK